MRSYNDVLSFVKEENIKFIKLAFIDAFGVPKNLAVIPEELERAFREGISFDASAVDGYDDGVKSDMFLNPDPDTLTIVPWRPMEGRVARMFCDVTNPDGTLYPKDTRYILKQATCSVWMRRGCRPGFRWIMPGIWTLRRTIREKPSGGTSATR